MASWQIRVIIIAAALSCFWSTAVWTQAVQAPRTPAMEQKQLQSAPAWIMMAAPIVVEAQTLTVSPDSPRAGDQVTARFTIKNAGSGVVATVPWIINIAPRSRTPFMAQGEKANVRPGTSFDVTFTWEATAGVTIANAHVGRILNSTAPPEAQQREQRIFVAEGAVTQNTVGAGAPKIVRQVLNYQKARAAGARFSHSVEGVGGCAEIGQYDRGGTTASVMFSATGCIYMGDLATPEAFTDFQLKNGWKIAGGAGTITVSPVGQSGNSDWQWTQRPNEGGINTAMKMHIWSVALGGIVMAVTVMIEGPEGSDPYAASVR